MALLADLMEIAVQTGTIISQFIREHLLREDDEFSFAPDISLVAAGVLDSVSVLKLLIFLEDEFNVRISDEELTPANFDTVARIATLIDDKRKATREPAG